MSSTYLIRWVQNLLFLLWKFLHFLAQCFSFLIHTVIHIISMHQTFIIISRGSVPIDIFYQMNDKYSKYVNINMFGAEKLPSYSQYHYKLIIHTNTRKSILSHKMAYKLLLLCLTQAKCTSMCTDEQLSTHLNAKVSGLDISDNNIFHNLYISGTYILYKL